MKKLNKLKVAILGDGGWGTTLAILLDRKGFKITLWGAFSDYTTYLDKQRVNTKFLPGIKIPKTIEITDDLKAAIQKKQIIVIAVPSQYVRSVLNKINRADWPREAVYLSVTKGIENGSLKRISEVIHELLGKVKLAVLSGPTIAHEVAKNLPTTAVVAAKDIKIRKFIQSVFMSENFRLYTNSDVIGVELGGSLKNVIAIACGISDGLKFGTNTKAAILARGLAEISRLGVVMGAKEKTFSGISGLGDLVTTCISQYSRNRLVGEKIGKGSSLKDIESKMQMIAEGVPTAKSAHALSLKFGVEMPITKEIEAVLFKNKSPSRAVSDLMTREKKEE